MSDCRDDLVCCVVLVKVVLGTDLIVGPILYVRVCYVILLMSLSNGNRDYRTVMIPTITDYVVLVVILYAIVCVIARFTGSLLFFLPSLNSLPQRGTETRTPCTCCCCCSEFVVRSIAGVLVLVRKI